MPTTKADRYATASGMYLEGMCMNWKDKKYYINKTKEVILTILTSAVFTFVMMYMLVAWS